MSNEGGPWQAERPDEEPPAPRPRRGLWLLFIAALLGLIFVLARAFPEAVHVPGDWAWLAYTVGLVVLVSSGLSRIRLGSWSQGLKHVAIWGAIIAVIALAYTYRDELSGVSQRLRIAASSGTPVATTDNELVIPRSENGAYLVYVLLNGQRVRFMVDTGATDTVLSPEDARRIGVKMEGLNYVYKAETANGVGYGAPYTLDTLEVGPIRLDDFRVVINQTPMRGSLLGLSFLSRLKSYEFHQDKLVLKWRE